MTEKVWGGPEGSTIISTHSSMTTFKKYEIKAQAMLANTASE
jgi:hypothetical protein